LVPVCRERARLRGFRGGKAETKLPVSTTRRHACKVTSAAKQGAGCNYIESEEGKCNGSWKNKEVIKPQCLVSNGGHVKWEELLGSTFENQT